MIAIQSSLSYQDRIIDACKKLNIEYTIFTDVSDINDTKSQIIPFGVLDGLKLPSNWIWHDKALLSDFSSGVTSVGLPVSKFLYSEGVINEKWRVFVLGKSYISQYEKNGKPFVTSAIGKKDKFAVNVLASTFNPLQTGPYVVDLCTVGSGWTKKYYILGYSGIHSAEFYDHDIQAIIKELTG